MLTETKIRKLPDPDKPVLIPDARGLYLRLAPTGTRSWQFRTRVGGAWRVVTLGKWPTMTLAAAREKAASLGNREDIPQAMTFGQLLDRWFEAAVEPKYTRNGARAASIYVAHGKSKLGSVQLTALSTQRLVATLDAYAETSPVASNRCLSHWRLCFDFAVQKGFIENNPLARVRPKLIGGTERPRERVLTDNEIRALMRDGLPFLKFLLLTGLRISEALNGYRDGDKWRIDVTKNGKPFWVHLPPLALEQLAEPWPWQNMGEYQEWLRVYCATEVEGESFTPHDLRRTFATRMAGLPDMPPWVPERCLNHSLPGIMAVYNRHEYEPERVAAAEAWANELAKIVRA